MRSAREAPYGMLLMNTAAALAILIVRVGSIVCLHTLDNRSVNTRRASYLLLDVMPSPSLIYFGMTITRAEMSVYHDDEGAI